MLLHHLNVVLYFIYWAALLTASKYTPRNLDWESSEHVRIKSYLEFLKLANSLNAW
jgi:hypothetical protein